jgi:magnesium chelatase subunit D
MKYPVYPFSAIVGQEEMKLALLLAAVDWRISVLLRGDKGAGKTTTARGLATLLPSPGPFVNLPIGATEDRLLGGLNIERALKGDPVLKAGLLSEAHGGVLYVDEVNLLPAHLGDMLLDTASRKLLKIASMVRVFWGFAEWRSLNRFELGIDVC